MKRQKHIQSEKHIQNQKHIIEPKTIHGKFIYKKSQSASGRMYTYHNMIVRYLIFRSDHTTFTNVNELSSSPVKRSF